MSLAPGEEQELAAIEDRLRRSDLRLAACLALFSRRAIHRGRGPAGERISPWRAGRRGSRLALAAVILSVMVAVGTVLACAV